MTATEFMRLRGKLIMCATCGHGKLFHGMAQEGAALFWFCADGTDEHGQPPYTVACKCDGFEPPPEELGR